MYADEAGWKVRGKLHWPDKSRGGQVIETLLGTCFQGLLISDAWHAYLKLQCEKQTCMAHIFRKIRTFRDAFPRYYSIVKFYEKLKKIIADGEVLQDKRGDTSDKSFHQKLDKLNKIIKCWSIQFKLTFVLSQRL